MNKRWATYLLLPLSAATLADDASPRLIALTCANCHAENGAAIPAIEGLSAKQIREALLDFKSGRRESTVMGRLAKGFSEREIEAVAQIIAVNGQ